MSTPRPGPAFADQDHEDLAHAETLINGVVERHRMDICLPAMSAFSHALLDIHLGEHYLAGVR